MYKEEILDLYKNPVNVGKLEDAQKAEGENPNCGDTTTFYVKTEEGKTEKIRHETDACAICTAANSIVAGKLEGEEIERIKLLDRDWIMDQLDIELSPMRVKCAVLGLNTLQKAISEIEE